MEFMPFKIVDDMMTEIRELKTVKKTNEVSSKY